MITRDIKCKIRILILIVFFSGSGFYSQSILRLEKNLENLRIKMTQEQIELDSLIIILSSKAARIETLSRQGQNQTGQVKELMSNSASLSTLIDIKQSRITKYSNEYELLKNIVYNLLTEKIDSLKTLPKTENTERQINTYTQKKLLSVPKIFTLKFDPKKILELEQRNKNNVVDDEIFSEYHSEALKEINNHLNGINDTYNQINGFIRLQEKTNAFVEESEFNSDVAAVSLFNNQFNDPTTGEAREGGDPEGVSDILEGSGELTYNVYAYKIIFNQLNYAGIQVKNKWIDPEPGAYSNFTLEEYKLFLEDLRTSLEEYRKILLRSKSENNDK